MKYLLLISFLFTSQTFSKTFFENPRIFVSTAGSKIAGGYVDIKNDEAFDITLKIVSAEGFDKAEMHETFIQDDMKGMREISSLVIKKGESFSFKPGAHHFMFYGMGDKVLDKKEIKVIFKINDKKQEQKFKVLTR